MGPTRALDMNNHTYDQFPEESRLTTSTASSELSQRSSTYHDYGPVVVGVLTFLLSVVMLVSILGNLLVIATILRNRNLRTRTNLLLCNLALADILVGVFDVPIALVTLINGDWIFKKEICKFNAYMVGMGIMLSLHTLMYISIHKFFSIKNIFKPGLSLRAIYMMVAAAWTWAILYNTLSALGWTEEKYKKGATQCGPVVPTTPIQISHSVVNKTFNFFVPLCVITVFYYKIFAIVREHLSRLDALTDVKMRNSLIQQKRILKTLVIVLVCFVLCYTPYIIYSSCLVFLKEKGVHPIFNPLAYLALYFNSACNPVIYSLMFPKFQKGFKEIICGRKPKNDWAKLTYKPPPPAVVRCPPQNALVSKNLLSVPEVQKRHSKFSAQPNAVGEENSDMGRFGFLVSSFRQSRRVTRSHTELSQKMKNRQKRLSQPLLKKMNQDKNSKLRRLQTAPPIRKPRTDSLISNQEQMLNPKTINNDFKRDSVVLSLTPSHQRKVSTSSALGSVVPEETKVEDQQSLILDDYSTINYNDDYFENGFTHTRIQQSLSLPNLVYGIFEYEETNSFTMDTLSPAISTENNFTKAVSHDNLHHQKNLEHSRAPSHSRLEQSSINTEGPLLRAPATNSKRNSKGRLSLANIFTSLKRSFTDLFAASSIDEADDDDPCGNYNENSLFTKDLSDVSVSPSPLPQLENQSRF